MRQASIQTLTVALQQLREHTLSAFACYQRADKLLIPLAAGLNPPLWELGHVAWFQEYWIARNQQRHFGLALDLTHARLPSALATADLWFDSAKVPHPSRWHQSLPTQEQCLQYAEQTLAQTLELLQQETNDSPALYFYWLVLQHEAMHLEASAYMAQALEVALDTPWRHLAKRQANQPSLPERVRLPAQTRTLGSGDLQFCFDNELSMQSFDLHAFEIALQPVNWGQYLAFVAATGNRLPPYLRAAGSGFETQVFGCWRPLAMTDVAVHLSWHDAQAYCAWAKCRLPTEAEWDCAAKTLQDFEWGDVWEWTQDTFAPFEGFVPHPYVEYSAPWFGSRKVLRGAAQLTHPVVRHFNYRNFFTPERCDIYAGFRTCAR
ncbi:MAG: hypothetical protein CK528_02910 [Alcaligenaceae bacterium]|nr:MAG: hypothetical protein CK528_02910 [Alcaligenaceae bacterium]